MGLLSKIIFCSTFFLITVVLSQNNSYAQGSSYSPADKIIKVTASSPIVKVRLASNPSTGYQWSLVKYNSVLMLPPSSYYVSAKSRMVGASGYSVWKFQFRKSAFAHPQKTQVILEYKRPWEKVEGRKQIINIVISAS